MVMHPIKPELDGTDLTEDVDPDGEHLFVESVKTVEADGAGFVEYQWPKPGSEAAQPKISYVAGYEPWGWIVGSGVYVDDVVTAARAEALALALETHPPLALVVLASVLVARSITRPLSRAVALLRSGDPSLRLPHQGTRNELDQLGGALNERWTGCPR